MESAHTSLCPHPLCVVVFCVDALIQSRLNVFQLVGPEAPPSICSSAFFSRARSTIPSSSIIFLCIGSSCGDSGHFISNLWESGISWTIPKSCKAPLFLSCSFMLKWALVPSKAQSELWLLLSGEVHITQSTAPSSCLAPCSYWVWIYLLDFFSWQYFLHLQIKKWIVACLGMAICSCECQLSSWVEEGGFCSKCWAGTDVYLVNFSLYLVIFHG